MSGFRTLRGFEDAWRPPVGRRRPEEVLAGDGGRAVRARLVRLVGRAPEVMVKVTGRTRDAAHLAAHLDYISRTGALALEDRDGWAVEGRAAVRELGDDWAAADLSERRRRTTTPLSRALVLSMPAGTDPYALRDAARAFAQRAFGERFEWAMALHTDEPHPHVHLTVRALGTDGARLNPKKADLQAWRALFAEALRDRGVEAEATPRRARGVSRKAERGPLRRIRQRFAAGVGAMARVERSAWRAAAADLAGGPAAARDWDAALSARQARVRALYLGQARLLQGAERPEDRALGQALEAFVRGMPAPETRGQAYARRLREAARAREPDAGRPPVDRGRAR